MHGQKIDLVVYLILFRSNTINDVKQMIMATNAEVCIMLCDFYLIYTFRSMLRKFWAILTQCNQNIRKKNFVSVLQLPISKTPRKTLRRNNQIKQTAQIIIKNVSAWNAIIRWQHLWNNTFLVTSYENSLTFS